MFPLDEIIHFDAITRGASGVVDADSTPTFDVFEEATDTPILAAQNFTKRTSLTGNYRGTATLSAANGFEVGKYYNIIATATVGAITDKSVILTFRVTPTESLAGFAKVDVHSLNGVAQSLLDLKDFADDGYDPSTNKVQGVVLVDTLTAYTGNTPQTGDGYAIVNSGTHGNAALKTLIDAVDNFVDTEVTEILTRIGVPSVSLTADIDALPTASEIWANGTRSLTILDEDSTTLDLDATIRAAIGMSSANLDTQLTAIDDLIDTEVGTILTRIGVPAVSLSSDIAAIEAQTDDIGAAGAGLTSIPWNSTWDAEVQSEVADALAVYDPPTKAELDSAVANVSVDEIQATALADMFNTDSLTTYGSAVAGSVVAEIADNAGGSGLTAAGIADAVWDEVLAGHLTGGSTGNALNAAGSAGDPWTTTLPGAYTGSQAGKILADILVDTGTTLQAELDDIETDVNTILTRIGVPSVSLAADLANVDSDIAALNDFNPATDFVFADIGKINGSFLIETDGGNIAQTFSTLFGSGTGAAPLEASRIIWGQITNNTTRILTALDEDTTTLDLDTTIRAALGLGSANLDTQLAKLDTIDDLIDTEIGTISTKLDTIDDFLDTEITAIITKLDTIDDLIDTEIGTILTRIGIPGTSLTASIAALNNISASQVNAEVVDALNVDTYTEPTGVPSATASLVSKIGRLYKALMRGIEITATEKRFLDAASAVEWKKTLADDGTTYDETTALAP